jgi:5S rRNA maturation endonuclease (ribonuclease M5)
MVSNIQMDLLKKYFNNIILLADNDEAGNTMRQKLIDKLGSRISVIKLDAKYKDIGDMDNETIKTLEYRFDNSIMSMLQ